MYSELDKGIIGAYQKAGGRKQFLKNQVKKVGSGIMSGAKAVNKMSGGENLSKYAGEKIAKATAKPEVKPYVSQTVSGKDAAKSAGKVALTSLSMLGAGAAAKAAQGLKGMKMKSAKSSLDRILKNPRRKKAY